MKSSTRAQALHNTSLSLEALQEVLSFHSRSPLDPEVKHRRDMILCKWYNKHYYDIHMIDMTADELLKGNASIWDDVLYKLYFVLCHHDIDLLSKSMDDDNMDDPSPASSPPIPTNATPRPTHIPLLY